MKIALLADIHANFCAFQAITEDIETWQPDLVIVAGDLVNRGPKPKECLDFVHGRIKKGNWHWLRGNHEDYVLDQGNLLNEQDTATAEVHRASHWTMQQLNGHDRLEREQALNQEPFPTRLQCSNLELLNAMPFQLNLLDPAGGLVSFVHASRRGIRDGIYPETPTDALNAKIHSPLPNANQEQVTWIGAVSGKAPLSLFGVGHTHRPLVRQLDETLVVNAGSAGLPFDQDTRPSYARLSFFKNQWQAEIQRCEYDLEQAQRDFYTSGYLEDGGPLVQLVMIELQTAQSQLYNWAIRYQERALQGEISMRESVERILAQT